MLLVGSSIGSGHHFGGLPSKSRGPKNGLCQFVETPISILPIVCNLSTANQHAFNMSVSEFIRGSMFIC